MVAIPQLKLCFHYSSLATDTYKTGDISDIHYCICSGEQSSMLDIAPNFAGSVMGIINAVGNVMGFVAPLVRIDLIARFAFIICSHF